MSHNELDPVCIFFRFVTAGPSSFWRKFFILILRLLQIPPTCQRGCLFPLIFLLLTTAEKMVLNIVHILYQTSYRFVQGPRKTDGILRSYLRLEIIACLFYQMLSSFIAALMAVGFILSITFNFVSIKMVGIIPMPFYLFFPSVAILIPVIIDFLLPMAISVHEDCLCMQNKWAKYAAHSGGTENIWRDDWRLQGRLDIMREFWTFVRLKNQQKLHITLPSYTTLLPCSCQFSCKAFNVNDKCRLIPKIKCLLKCVP